MRRPAIVVMAICLLAVAALFVVPYFTRDRQLVASVPSPAALDAIAFVPVAPGQAACFDNAAIERHSEEARFQVATGGRRGSPLELRLAAPGWTQTVAVRGGYADGAHVQARIRPPRTAVLARVCIVNRGVAPIKLYASGDRTRSRSIASVDGHSTRVSVWFALYERRPVSLASRLQTTFERMSAFRSGLIGPWLFWLLLAGILVAMPVAVVWAYGAALRDPPD